MVSRHLSWLVCQAVYISISSVFHLRQNTTTTTIQQLVIAVKGLKP